jgi:hypothetical protein
MDQPQGSKVRATDIPVSVGKPTPEQSRKWLKQQVVYRNFAGIHDELDQHVAAFVSNHRARFYNRMGKVMERWETIWDAANGNPMWGEYDDDIHVPETQKKLNAKVARIEEALFEFDPIFMVEGTRGDLPQWKAQVIQSYVYRMMELGNFRDLVQPVARDAEICNVAAIKLRWNMRNDFVVYRKWEMRERSDGTTYYHDERYIREASTVGVRYDIVDPFLFLYDIDCGDLNSDDCAFVGDESDQFVHDLEAMAKNGLFSEKNVKLVRDRRAGSANHGRGPEQSGDWPDIRRQARNIATGVNFSLETRGDHDPRKVRCVELWGWFDFGDGFDGVVDPLGARITGTHKVVVTVANGVVIQFRLNPFDRKFHPYAIARINRNGHESVAPSNFEQVVQVNAQYDSYQSTVLRHAQLTAAPILRTAGEFPTDSLLHVKPGHVFSNTPSDIQEIRVGDIPSSVTYFHSFFRNECEEASGALNVFESPQGTATETERKVQEQQRMIRNSIRALGELFRQLALKTYWVCAQFSTGPQRFAVVGKAAMQLGKTFEITPDIMQNDIDVRFLGVDNIHVFGNRLAGMANWMNRWGPLLPSLPAVNIMALCRQDYELSVGKAGIEEVFPAEEAPWSTWTQEEENEMLLSGLSVPVSTADDDDDHLKKMEPLYKMIRTGKLPKYAQRVIQEHTEQHVLQAQRKMAEQQAQMRETMMQQMIAGGTPGVDKPPAEGGMPAPSKAQQPGVAPGPMQERTASKPGRSLSPSQQQVMSQ